MHSASCHCASQHWCCKNDQKLVRRELECRAQHRTGSSGSCQLMVQNNSNPSEYGLHPLGHEENEKSMDCNFQVMKRVWTASFRSWREAVHVCLKM